MDLDLQFGAELITLQTKNMQMTLLILHEKLGHEPLNGSAQGSTPVGNDATSHKGSHHEAFYESPCMLKAPTQRGG